MPPGSRCLWERVTAESRAPDGLHPQGQEGGTQGGRAQSHAWGWHQATGWRSLLTGPWSSAGSWLNHFHPASAEIGCTE
jgi:hypothetical protein